MGSCRRPLMNPGAVVVSDKELTLVLALRLTACNKVPDGLENCTLVPSAALSCATTELMPPEKLMPMTRLFALDEVLAGRVPAGPSATSVTVCWMLLESV